MSTAVLLSRSVPEERMSGRDRAMLLVLCGALFLDGLDVSMIGVALPSIRADLGLSTGALQWVVSGYVLGYAGFLLLGGRAADLFGRRRTFLVALAVFTVASGLGGLAPGGGLLIAARFITGVAAAFTAPAGVSIITTSFAEGTARNRALSIYAATGACGFSMGLVIGGSLTTAGWRWVFFVPVVLAAVTLTAATRLIPTSPVVTRSAAFDLSGAVTLTATMLLLIFGLVEAPVVGWGSARTIAELAGAIVFLAIFVAIEQRSTEPLVRLGILRSASLRRANFGAMSLFGAWLGCLFIATLYMQQLLGWSSLRTGLAVFPSGLIVAILAPRIAAPLVGRFGTTRVILTGILSTGIGYALFLRIDLHSNYATTMLPTFVFVGLGFALAYGPLNIAATNGIDASEQGLAGGLVNTSFQFGGALVLAVVAAVYSASVDTATSPSAVLNGFHHALIVPLIAAIAGAAVTATGLREQR